MAGGTVNPSHRPEQPTRTGQALGILLALAVCLWSAALRADTPPDKLTDADAKKTAPEKKTDAPEKKAVEPEKKAVTPAAEPEGPDAERYRLLRQLYREDPLKAAEGFRAFLAEFPKSDLVDDARYWLAQSLERGRAKRRDVLAAYQDILDKHPDSSYREQAHFSLADVWQKRAERPEDYDAAIKAFGKFMEACPRSERVSEATLRIGEIYDHLGKHEDAATWYRKVVEEHAESKFSLRASMQLASTCLKLKRTDEALAIYTKLLQQDMDDRQRITVHLGMVDGYLQTDDGLEKARETSEEIREEARRKKALEDYADFRTRERMAQFYAGRKKYTEAEAEFQAYIERYSTSPGVWQARLNIGMIRLAAGRHADAREMFRAVMKEYPIDREKASSIGLQAAYYEAYTLEAEKNREEAREHYARLVEHHAREYYGRRARTRIERIDKQIADEKKKAEEEARKAEEEKKTAEKKPEPKADEKK